MMNHQTPSTPAGGARRRSPAGVVGALVGTVGVVVLLVLQAVPASAQGVAPAGHGWIRFGHFSPTNGPVKVSLDGKVVTRSASFETVTPYQPVLAGTHTISLTELDAPHTTLTDKVVIPSTGAITVGALQGPHGVELKWFDDNLAPGPAGDAKVRIIDTAPSAPNVKVVLERTSTSAGATQTAVITSPKPSAALRVASPVVDYGAASSYQYVAAGRYTVMVSSAAGNRLITGHNWPVVAGTVASIVVVQAHGRATLEVLDDAAGATAAPTGGMETGYGGAARALAGGHPSGDSRDFELIGLVLVIGLGSIGARQIIRRSRPGRNLPEAGAALGR